MIRLFFALLSFALLSCGAKGTKETGNMPEIKKQPITSAVPDFNADSAYAYVANQVAFGPRPLYARFPYRVITYPSLLFIVYIAYIIFAPSQSKGEARTKRMP